MFQRLLKHTRSVLLLLLVSSYAFASTPSDPSQIGNLEGFGQAYPDRPSISDAP